MTTGNLTALDINVLSGLLQGRGLALNATMKSLVGVFAAPATAVTDYTIGTNSVTKSIDDLTRAMIANPTTGALRTIGAGTIPALGNSPPTTFAPTVTYAGPQAGFISYFSWQAYNEFTKLLGTGTLTYAKFCGTLGFYSSWAAQINDPINSAVNAKAYQAGVYSNTNDMITSDIAGISSSMPWFGSDLINLGKSISLSRIDTFGYPQNLLQTINNNRAMTASLNLALLSSGFTVQEASQLLEPSYIATDTEQTQIYAAFTVITGTDLVDILTPLNVKTQDLNTLADLLDPIKMFPLSYSTLTVPRYNLEPGSSKVYDFIYIDGGINSRILDSYGTDLTGIIPQAQAIACSALSISFQQVKNIQSMDFERFAQIAANLETAKGLAIGTATTPLTPGAADTVLNLLALGSGVNGTYTMSNFLGCASGVSYTALMLQAQALITSLATPALKAAYASMLTDPTHISTYIAAANTEITRIRNTRPAEAAQLNTVWNRIGTLLKVELNAIARALPNPTIIEPSLTQVLGFVGQLNTYAIDTGPDQMAQVLEMLSVSASTDSVAQSAGQNLIASMRAKRNNVRLALTGGDLEMALSPIATESLAEYSCLAISIPKGGPLPACLTDTPAENLIYREAAPVSLEKTSCNLMDSVYTPAEAITQVTTCNCDCWNNA